MFYECAAVGVATFVVLMVAFRPWENRPEPEKPYNAIRDREAWKKNVESRWD